LAVREQTIARIDSISPGAAAKWILEERALASARTTRLDQRISVPKWFLVSLSAGVECIARRAKTLRPLNVRVADTIGVDARAKTGDSFLLWFFCFLFPSSSSFRLPFFPSPCHPLAIDIARGLLAGQQ
jgi:hypothetical protein